MVAEQHIDPSGLDGFAFASRKQPEYMHFRLVACHSCDLLFASPAPAAGALAAAYQQADYDSGDEAAQAARTYIALVRAIGPRLAHASSALDIGAGDGAFLAELLNAGFTDVAGVEPSEAPRLAAPEAIRPLIQPGTFAASAFEGRRFDLVTCFQTIEHVHDPRELCRDVYGLLKPGGAFLLVGHNRRSLSAHLLGRRSPIFDIEHLQLFSPASLHLLLGGAGFTDVSVRPVLNRYPVRYWLRLAPVPAALKTRALRALQGDLGGFSVTLPAGNLAALGFRP